MNKTKVLWIESLRGIACLIVLIAHIMSIHPTNGMFANGCGKIAVWFFFIISAFFTLYNFDINQLRWDRIKNYYWNRIVKLYPTYIVGLVFAYFTGFISDIKSIFEHIFLISGQGHFWYMTVIIKFFLFVPLIRYIYAKINNDKIILGLLFVIGSLFAIIFPWNTYVENSISLRWYIPVFCMGLALSVIFKENNQARNNSVGDVLVILAFFIIGSMTPYMRWKIWGIPASRFLQNKYLFVGVLWCIIIVGILYGKYIKKFLNKAIFLHVIGKYSYEIYIFHYLLLILFRSLQVPWELNALLTLSGSVVISVVLRGIYSCVKR